MNRWLFLGSVWIAGVLLGAAAIAAHAAIPANGSAPLWIVLAVTGVWLIAGSLFAVGRGYGIGWIVVGFVLACALTILQNQTEFWLVVPAVTVAVVSYLLTPFVEASRSPDSDASRTALASLPVLGASVVLSLGLAAVTRIRLQVDFWILVAVLAVVAPGLIAVVRWVTKSEDAGERSD